MPEQRPAATRPHRGRLDPATITWLLLVLLTLASALTTVHGAHPGWRLAAGLAVAALCALKGRLLVQGYLQPRAAGPLFDRLVRVFAALAPALLALSALREGWRALAG